ncbi:60S ribosomal protein L6 [Capsicum annuum]|uniref:60S ribosomal protein L6 n=1 Tax=Capsicum annuum TaxID=4072 RepID=A0A2G2ZK37_CAPAN|nr:60S ribosomal protein L6 [Capsicum annuum]
MAAPKKSPRNPNLINGIGKFSRSKMFKGKRVVFLKQLVGSGLLLVTGPFKVNGVPLRRVNQAYVIATSTKVDVSGVNVEKIDDKYFAKQVEKKVKKGEGEFFEEKKEEKNVLPQEKKDEQKAVDTALLKAIEGVPELKAYLAARMNLSTKFRVLMVVKVPRKLIKWWGTFNYSEKHEVRKVLGNLVALLDLTPCPDLIEVVLTFGDPNNLVFRFGSCELTLTLAEMSHLFQLPIWVNG